MNRNAQQRIALGRFGEDFAASYLSNCLGWQLHARNWRCRAGEIDIVAFDGNVLVTVEVKTRQTTLYGSALESVNYTKVRRLERLLQILQRIDGKCATYLQTRIDIVALTVRGARVAQLEHIRDVCLY